MSNLTERTHRIAVSLGKAENYRASTAKLVAELADYLRTDDGAAEAVAAGVPPTLEGVFILIRDDEAYPRDAFNSFGSFKRLLRIGRAPDPIAMDQAVRDEQTVANAKVSVTRKEAALARAENLQEDFDPMEPSPVAGRAAVHTDIILSDHPEEEEDEIKYDEFGDPLWKIEDIYNDEYDFKTLCLNFIEATEERRQLRRAAVKLYNRITELEKELGEVELERDRLLSEQEAVDESQWTAPVVVPKPRAPKPKPEPISPRVAKAVELFFASDRQLWLKQRMKDLAPMTAAAEGPHVEWIKTYYNCLDAEQQAIKEAIETETSRRAAWISRVPARRFRPAIRAGPFMEEPAFDG